MAVKFTVYKDKKGEFRFRLIAANGEIIATGEGYPTKAAVLKGIAAIKKNAPIAEIEDETAEKKETKKTAVKTTTEKAKTEAKAKAATKTGAKPNAKPRGRKPKEV